MKVYNIILQWVIVFYSWIIAKINYILPIKEVMYIDKNKINICSRIYANLIYYIPGLSNIYDIKCELCRVLYCNRTNNYNYYIIYENKNAERMLYNVCNHIKELLKNDKFTLSINKIILFKFNVVNENKKYNLASEILKYPMVKNDHNIIFNIIQFYNYSIEEKEGTYLEYKYCVKENGRLIQQNKTIDIDINKNIEELLKCIFN